MFSGKAPEGDWLALAGWLLPAFFVAFAMDVGQISTSAAIRHNGLTWQRGLAFFVFAVATYYLQFLYIAHHMPALEIAPGISAFHRWAVETGRDAAIWILPLLLPLSTMLYTISDGDSGDKTPVTLPEPVITLAKPEQPTIAENISEFPALTSFQDEIIQEPKYPAYCDDCGWAKEYEHPHSASRALATHKNKHCSKRHEPEEVIQANGHVE
jgi:hypothetical protein